MNLNARELKDKIHACWIGKNIGGTMGAPYEGTRELLDVTGYATPPNKVLPNDDLDLQLVWLKAVEDYGFSRLDEKILGEYWTSFITGQWNEYGIAKLNLADGLVPPLSGSYHNDWKNSNGAWIRAEIWASMAPACPDVAAKYAKMDSMVDHGAGEGTYGAIFVAAMESAAFVQSDIRKLIEIGLSKIPKNCRVAKAVRLVVDCYDRKVDWADTRNAVLEEVKDIGNGWFEAPGNIAYVILGLLYGEGDFKKSMITAINCADDTDCTAATVGSILGIIGGTGALPEDWVEHIGDTIITCALNCGLDYRFPSSCKDLTERVFAMIPLAMQANHIEMTIGDGKNSLDQSHTDKFTEYNDELILVHDGYYFEMDFIHCKVSVCFENEPEIGPLEDVKIKFYVTGNTCFGNTPRNLSLRWILPDGWSVTAPCKHYQQHMTWHYSNTSSFEAVVHAGEKVEAVNRIILEMVASGRPTACLIPMSIIGK